MYSIVDTKVHEYLAYCFNVVQDLESQIKIKHYFVLDFKSITLVISLNSASHDCLWTLYN